MAAPSETSGARLGCVSCSSLSRVPRAHAHLEGHRSCSSARRWRFIQARCRGSGRWCVRFARTRRPCRRCASSSPPRVRYATRSKGGWRAPPSLATTAAPRRPYLSSSSATSAPTDVQSTRRSCASAATAVARALLANPHDILFRLHAVARRVAAFVAGGERASARAQCHISSRSRAAPTHRAERAAAAATATAAAVAPWVCRGSSSAPTICRRLRGVRVSG
jgi:hypothetical protein